MKAVRFIILVGCVHLLLALAILSMMQRQRQGHADHLEGTKTTAPAESVPTPELARAIAKAPAESPVTPPRAPAVDPVLAWTELVSAVEVQSDKSQIIALYWKFLQHYPDHQSAPIARERMDAIAAEYRRERYGGREPADLVAELKAALTPPSAPSNGRREYHSPMSIWTSYAATGATWRTASESERWAFVDGLARASRYGNSANYFYDAFSEMFSGDSGILSMKMSAAAGMVDAAGKHLPARMKSY